jgi:hypothetical protein
MIKTSTAIKLFAIVMMLAALVVLRGYGGASL